MRASLLVLVLLPLLAAVAVAVPGCGPCATLSGQHHNVAVFATSDNAAQFQACRQSGNCLPLCKSFFEGTGEGFIVDECHRDDADAGAGGSPDQITVSFRYHIASCG